MRHVVFVLPGLIGASESESFLPRSGVWADFVSFSTMTKLRPWIQGEAPECALFGLDPAQFPVHQGPLTAAAFKVDPPTRSVIFHATLGSCSSNGMLSEAERIHPDELSKVLELVAQLNTWKLTFVSGESQENILVWEGGSLEMGSTPWAQAVEKNMCQVLPEGDGEVVLRRYIDDSINLLSGHDFNKRRIDQGLAPINVIWPWGQGFARSFPNLVLRHGKPWTILSRDLRMRGLTNLVGFVQGDRQLLGNGFNIDWKGIADISGPLMVSETSFERCREAERLDAAEKIFKWLMQEFCEPALRASQDDPILLEIIATSPKNLLTTAGYGLTFDSRYRLGSNIPFDERLHGETRLREKTLWEFVDFGI